MKRAGIALGLVLGLWAAGVFAADAESAASNPALEARVQRVAEELRCLVCQNQTIADSNAGLAIDLRREVREMLVRGSNEAEVREFMVNRYGDFILYRPPFKVATLALWVGPFVLLGVGFWIHRRAVTARPEGGLEPGMTAQDDARLRSLIGVQQESERS